MIAENEVDTNCFLLVQNHSVVNMQHLKPKMSRLTFVHLLLAWLLLVASQPRFSTGIRVQAAEAVHFKLKPAQLASKSHKGNVLPVWVAEKRIHKSPSGPNPVGNHNPPSKQ